MTFVMPGFPTMRAYGFASIALCLAACRLAAEVRTSGDSMPLLAGMVLKNAVFLFGAKDQEQRTRIGAERAFVEPSTDLLRLEGMVLSARRNGETIAMTAPVANCHLARSMIYTAGASRIRGKGWEISGENLEANASTLVFRTDLPLEASSETDSAPRLTKSCASDEPGISPWTFPAVANHSSIQCGARPFALHLVQEFSGNLATFARCWRRVESTSWPDASRATGPVAMTSPHGGIIDLSQHKMKFAGPSAILAPNAVLISNSGLRLYRDTSEDEPILRLSGEGGVTGWMKSLAKEYRVRASYMDFAGDLPILQFEGGPVRFQNGNMILQATEEWQFLRVMENGRIVISPGSWATHSAQEG